MAKKALAIGLLALMALAGALTYYAWEIGLIMGKERERLAVRWVACDGPERLLICLENTGPIPLTITELYVLRPDGSVLRCFGGYVFAMSPLLPEELKPGRRVVFWVEWEEGHGLSPRDDVLVRAKTARGNTFEGEGNRA